MGHPISARLAVVDSQNLRRCCLWRPAVRVNVYLPKRFQCTHSIWPNGNGHRMLLGRISRRSLSESRLSSSPDQYMYNKLCPTLRLFTSSCDQDAPDQPSLSVPDASEDLDVAESLSVSAQEPPDDLDPDMIILKPDLGPNGHPPLPSIQNEATLLRVFTHRSFYARPSNVFEDSPTDPSPDNEVLEHLGDSVLSLTITTLINERHPHLRVGPATKIRAMVVGNLTLAGISVNYRLPASLRLHRAQAASLRASIKVQADVFEAYVGGVYTDRGTAITQSWLSALFEPYVQEAYRVVRMQHGLPPAPPSPMTAGIIYDDVWAPQTLMVSPASVQSSPDGSTNTSDEEPPPRPRSSVNQSNGHLALLNQRLQQSRKSVEWNYSKEPGPGTRTTPRWKAICMFDGRLIATGMGTTKKAAQNAAAREGLVSLDVPVE